MNRFNFLYLLCFTLFFSNIDDAFCLFGFGGGKDDSKGKEVDKNATIPVADLMKNSSVHLENSTLHLHCSGGSSERPTFGRRVADALTSAFFGILIKVILVPIGVKLYTEAYRLIMEEQRKSRWSRWSKDQVKEMQESLRKLKSMDIEEEDLLLLYREAPKKYLHRVKGGHMQSKQTKEAAHTTTVNNSRSSKGTTTSATPSKGTPSVTAPGNVKPGEVGVVAG